MVNKIARSFAAILFLFIAIHTEAAQVITVDCTNSSRLVTTGTGSTQLQPPLPQQIVSQICTNHSSKKVVLNQRCTAPGNTSLQVSDYLGVAARPTSNFKYETAWEGCSEQEEYIKCVSKGGWTWWSENSVTIPFFFVKPSFLKESKLFDVQPSPGTFLLRDTPGIHCTYTSSTKQARINLELLLEGGIGAPVRKISQSCSITSDNQNPPNVITTAALEKNPSLEQSHYKNKDKNKTRITLFSCGVGDLNLNVDVLSKNCDEEISPEKSQACREAQTAAQNELRDYENTLRRSNFALFCGKADKVTICASEEMKRKLKSSCLMTDQSIQAFCNQSAVPQPPPGPCGSDASLQDTEMGEICVCNDRTKTYQASSKTCIVPVGNEVECHNKGKGYVFSAPNSCRQCTEGLRLDGNKCGCFTNDGYHPVPAAAGGCQYQPAPVGGSCQALEGSVLQGNRCVCPSDQRPNDQQNKCVPKEDFTVKPPVPEPRPASCRGQQGTAGDGQIRVNGQCSDCQGNSVPNRAKDACVPGTQGDRTPGHECTKDGVTGRFDNAGQCVVNIACFSSSSCGEGRRCQNGQCQSICQSGEVFQNGRCGAQQLQCAQGQRQQIRSTNPLVIDCVPDSNNQQQCKQDEEMIQGRCFPKKPNAQQPKEQPKQQPQGQTPQQQQQQQMLQAMQECQMRQPPGAWQWNGFQCLPNPNYKPQNYGAQPSVTAGVVCNFFGSDAIEVPAGEQFSVTYDVSGAKREIKVDTSPKSTTQYQRQAPTTQPANTSVLNQFGYGQDGSVPGTTVQTSQQGQATITAPKKKGKLKVSLIVDAVRQNSEACKPITVTITDAVSQQGSYDTSGSSSSYDSGTAYPASSERQDTGPTIETPSEIIAQNRKTISSQPAQKAPEDDDAYAYLCKTLGIGCAKDETDTNSTPSIRDLQLRNEPAQGTTREITIDPNAEDPADLPNIGDIPGESGVGQGQQQLASDIGVDGDNKKAYSTVLNYLGENGQYAEPIGPNSDNSGVLNSTDAEPPTQTEDRIGIFTRLWRWFLNLLGFGPEYVAA